MCFKGRVARECAWRITQKGDFWNDRNQGKALADLYAPEECVEGEFLDVRVQEVLRGSRMRLRTGSGNKGSL